MAIREEVECIECGKKETFADIKDITYSHWKILAWNVKTVQPVCVCDKCEYNQSKKKDK